MQKFDLVVVTYEPFPYGQAATNRLLSYLVGLAESKRILYLCLAGVQKNNLNTKQDGIYKNINFKYLTDPTINNLNKIQRFAYVIYRYILLFFILAFKIKTKSILLYSCKKVLSIEILELCRLKKIKVFRDITEVVGFNYSKINITFKCVVVQEIANATFYFYIFKNIFFFFKMEHSFYMIVFHNKFAKLYK